MILFNKYGIKVFASDLPETTPERGPGRMLAERAAVKRLLREAFPNDHAIAVGHHESGAPFLTREGEEHPGGASASHSRPLPSISITHCRKMAAIAIAPSGVRLGIDCENGGRMQTLQRVTDRFLSPSQMEEWGDYPSSLWAWCIKEAAYKAAMRPGLALSWIPLPLEIPVGEATPDSVIEIAGTDYNVLQVDTLDRPIVLMLVFAESSTV